MAALAALAAIMLVLTGCAGAPEGGASGEGSAKRVQIVASTNVYGQIAEQIGGDRVDVTSIISSGSQDPHSYEATARDQLAISRAQLVIENGGGFDAFIARLIGPPAPTPCSSPRSTSRRTRPIRTRATGTRLTRMCTALMRTTLTCTTLTMPTRMTLMRTMLTGMTPAHMTLTRMTRRRMTTTTSTSGSTRRR